MGYPLNSYSLFKAFVTEEKQFYKKEAVRALAPFTIYAFLLFDKEEHSEFYHYVSSEFAELDYASGQRLLFFTLADPSDEMKKMLHRRHTSINISNFENSIVPNALNSLNPDLSALAIATQLNIPSKDLPCIVLTTNLQSQEYIYIKTNKSILRSQLSELGFFAWKAFNNYGTLHFKTKEAIIYKELLGFIKRVSNLNKNKQEIRLSEGMAKTLSDVLAFMSGDYADDEQVRKQALEQATKVTKEMYNELIKLSSDPLINESLEAYRSELAIKIALFTSLREFVPVPPPLQSKKELLEVETFKLLKTAYFSYSNTNNFGNSDIDYTPSTMCFAKAFEIEANLSVVQWIRETLGVTFPKYFNQVDPSISDAVIGNVNFNQGGRNSSRRLWRAPGIGQSLYGWRIQIERQQNGNMSPHLFLEWDSKRIEELKYIWSHIVPIRNSAAHTGLVDYSQAKDMKEQLDILLKDNYFNDFNTLKRKYNTKSKLNR